jgi:hypothetical protein
MRLHPDWLYRAVYNSLRIFQFLGALTCRCAIRRQQVKRAVINRRLSMPRNMSFSLTTAQIRNRTKTVTRRNEWWFLKPGEIVNAFEKAMGLKKGEKKRICQIRIVSAWAEPLNAITRDNVEKERFPNWTPQDFIKMYSKHNHSLDIDPVNRIEFEYV